MIDILCLEMALLLDFIGLIVRILGRLKLVIELKYIDESPVHVHLYWLKHCSVLL